jgi:hypothetical protein
MSAKRKTRPVLAAAAVVILLAAWLGYKINKRTHVVREISGTVLSVDPDERTASIEFIHPRTGKAFQLTGHVPETCDITIDGKPATLRDIRVGDVVRAQGALANDKTITVNWARIQRAANTATAHGATTTHAAGAS